MTGSIQVKSNRKNYYAVLESVDTNYPTQLNNYVKDAV